MIYIEHASLQKLRRKLSPSITNAATSYSALLHVLQACHVCSARVTFCPVCHGRATEFFHTVSPVELEKGVGGTLPPPDPDVVDDFQTYLGRREEATMRMQDGHSDSVA
jgi:hypothetical protein